MSRLAIGVAVASLAACFPSHRAGDLECETQADCSADRTCESGFCTKNPCPPECSSCDVAAATCEIDCSTGLCANPVTCPSGYDCTIACIGASACATIDCTAAASCNIVCESANACGSVTCGTGACTVQTVTPNACQSVSCTSSCRCDVQCLSAMNTCPTTTCPMADTCTTDGTPATLCSSTSCASC